jgi:hypothetical protein
MVAPPLTLQALINYPLQVIHIFDSAAPKSLININLSKHYTSKKP